MKRLPKISILCLVFAFTACQKDNPQELDAIIEHQLLQEEIQQLASAESVKVQNVIADKRLPTCNEVSFSVALAEFIERNQQKANETCQIVKGPVTGCHEGFMTYATALAFPDPSICKSFIANIGEPHE